MSTSVMFPATRRRLLAVMAIAALVVASMLASSVHASAAEPIHPVMNTSEYQPDGVFFRNSPDWSDTSRVTGWGIYAGDQVKLRCWSSGTDVPRLDNGSNTIWYQAENVTQPSAPGPRPNSGWVNAHFVNDGTGPNEVAPGVPPCGGAAPSGGGASPPAAPSGAESSGTAFGRSCGAVTLLAIPGSTETTEGAGFDVAQAMLANVTNALNTDDSVRTHYLGYPALLAPSLRVVGTTVLLTPEYDASRSKGYEAAWSTIDYYAKQCPYTTFVLLGYSQGAHIAGDLAATIGKESSPVSADRVRSVRLLADPARSPGQSPLIGMDSGGEGGLVVGDRGDFGSLDDRVSEYCVASDGVCNATPSSIAGLIPTALRGGPHTSYATTTVSDTGRTFTERMTDDLVQDVINLNGVTY